MSDFSLNFSDNNSPALSSDKTDKELQEFLLIEKQKAQLNAQVKYQLSYTTQCKTAKIIFVLVSSSLQGLGLRTQQIFIGYTILHRERLFFWRDGFSDITFWVAIQ